MGQSSQSHPIVKNIPPSYCYNPVDLAAVVEGNLVTFSWTPPHDNDGFYLSYWVGIGAPVQVTVFGNAIQLSLAANTTYNWSVRTMCDRLAPRGSEIILGVPVTTGAEGIACPTINIASAVVINSGTTSRLEWTNLAGITQYIMELKYGNNMPISITANNYFLNLNILLPNTMYKWRVRPVCAKLSNFSDWAWFTTGIPDPNDTILVSGQMDITAAIVYWTSYPEVLSYKVYLNNTLIVAEHPVNIITLPNLLPATQYTVMVIPNYKDGPGNAASFVGTTRNYTVANPSNLAAIFEDNSLKISWLPAVDIDSQELYINGSYIPLADDVINYTLPNPVPGTKIPILVKSVLAGKKSTGAFTSFAVPSFCQKVTGLRTTIVTDNTIVLAWGIVSGAASYRVKWKPTTDDDWNIVNTVNSLFVLDNLDPEVEYQFEVITVCASGNALAATLSATTIAIPDCPVITDVVASNVTSTTADISFGLSDGRTPFEGNYVVIADDGITPVQKQGTQSPIQITGLAANTAYIVKVYNRCSTNDDNNAPTSVSEEINVLTLKTCTAPAALTAVLQTNNTELHSTWSASAGATDYNFKYRRLGVLDWTDAGNNAAVNKTIAGILSAMYEVKVTTNYNDYRECSSTKTITIPKVLSLTKSAYNNISTFTWDKILGVQSYIVTLVTIANTYTIKTLGASLKVRLEYDTNYTVSVQAYYDGVLGAASDNLIFNSGAQVEETEDDTCDPPVLTAFKQDSNINDPDITASTKEDVVISIVNYNRSLKYVIDIIIAGYAVPLATLVIEPYSETFSGTAIFEQLAINSYYTIVTMYSGVTKLCDASQTVNPTTCAVPTGLAGADITDTGFTASWDEMTNAIAYEVYLDDEYVETVVSDHYIFSGLDADTDYDVKVRSKCSPFIKSVFSTPVTVHTAVAL
jgi:hypothetical protein